MNTLKPFTRRINYNGRERFVPVALDSKGNIHVIVPGLFITRESATRAAISAINRTRATRAA